MPYDIHSLCEMTVKHDMRVARPEVTFPQAAHG